MELMEKMKGWEGYVDVSGRHTDAELTTFHNLLSNADNVPAHLHEYRIKEALTTSDFPLLFGDVLDRQVLAAYKAVDPVWKAFTRMSTNRDFKVSKRFAVTVGDQYIARVAEKGEYLTSERNEAEYELSVLKYGRQFDISWESMINDDLGALKDTPTRFAMAAVRTEHRIVTGMYADDTGTHVLNAFLYDNADAVVANRNWVTTALTIASLETGVEAMAGFLDVNGEPIMNRAKYLVVPPALEMTARQILTSINKMWVVGAAGTMPAGATAYPMTNTISQYGLQLIVDPYLPIMDTTHGNTGWYLFANPSDIAALEAAHLRGHERPEICMKASDKVTVGGGAINPMSGDFATDNVFYRVRLVFGGCTLDWRATYAGGL